MPAWEGEYDRFALQNVKIRFKCKGCVLSHGMWEDNVHLLIRTAYPRRGEAMLARYRRLRLEYPKACRHGLMALLKLETGFMKMGATKITPYWREFCYWETSYGYIPPKEVDELWPEVKTWLCTNLKLGGPMGEGAYLRALQSLIRC